MPSSLHANLTLLAGKRNFRAGLELFRAGAVLDIRRSSRATLLRVANSQRTFERVRVLTSANQLTTHCTCGQAVPVCDHAVAAVLRFAAEDPAALQFLFTPAETPTPPPKPPRRAQTQRRRTKKVAPPADSSGLKVASIPALIRSSLRPGQLELNLADPLQTMESRWRTVTLTANLRLGQRTYSAANMRKLIEGSHAAGNMELQDFSPQEEEIIRFLVGHAEQSGTVFKLRAHDVADLFHCLTDCKSLNSPDGPLHIHRERLELAFETTAGGDRPTVCPCFWLPEHGRLPPKRFTYIVGRTGCWIGLGREYWWLPGLLAAPWLRLFLRGQPVALDPQELESLAQLCAAGRFPAQVIPEGSAHQLGQRSGTCKPMLLLDWSDKGVHARLLFDYHGHLIDHEGPKVIWGRNRFVARDERKEAAAWEHLRNMSFEPDHGHSHILVLTAAESIWSFVHDHMGGFPSDWRVSRSLEFSRRFSLSRIVQFAVQPGDEGGSWFEVRVSLVQVDGAAVEWEPVANAARREQSYVHAKGAGVLRVPSSLGRLLRTFFARMRTEDDGLFRFGIYSALPVADAVAPYWSGPRMPWQDAHRDLLRSASVEPVRLPPGLAGRLRDYQKQGIAWLQLLESRGLHGVLADEMGLGKTVQALGVILAAHANGSPRGPSLVVCPTSLLDNWHIEARRFAPSLRAVIVRGADRAALLPTLRSFDLVITSYSLLRRDIGEYRSIAFTYAILDEAQHIKNADTVNAKTCKELQARHRLILTGTPMENSLSELWSLFDFLLPGLLGSRRFFREEYEAGSDADDKREAAAELGTLIRPFMLRRTKLEVCRQLPPKIEQLVYCELEDEQRELYEAVLNRGRTMLRSAVRDGWNAGRFDILAVLLRLRQLCCHPTLLPDDWRDGYPVDGPSAKTALLQEIILQAIDGSHRILLFSQFTSLLRLLVPWLDQKGIRYEYLDGSTKDRQARVDRFNGDASIPVFLLSLKAGGTGLNLTGADTVVHYDQWWNPMVEDQATDRSHRIGQDRPVTSLKLIVRNTIEERVLALQDSKRELFNDVMAGTQTKYGELTPEDIEFLLSRIDR